MFEWLADQIVYQWLGMSSANPMGAALHFFVYDTPKIILMLAMAIFVISVLRSYLPQSKIKALLGGKKRVSGNMIAAGIGVLTPFCSCSAIPMFIGLMEAGVPLGVTLSFLIASPMVNEIALVMLWGLFGWKVAVLYMVSGFTIAVFGGCVLGKMNLEHLVEDYVGQCCCAKQEEEPDSFGGRCRAAAAFTRELLGQILPYIIIALAVGGVIHGYVPEEFLVTYAGRDNPLAVPLVVAIGVPLYNSASGMVPIVYALMEKGLPLGTVLALMMAVAGVSLPEIIILRKVLKPKLIALFVGVITASIILTGYLFNGVV